MATKIDWSGSSIGSKSFVNFILDRSSSMLDVLDETIKGFAKYIETLQADKSVEYVFSLTLFGGHDIDKRYVAEPIARVVPLSTSTYVPDGYTPLYDAIGKTTEEAIKLATGGERVLTVIMTDGHENSSTSWTKDKVKELIDSQRAKGWEFIYLGATLDAMDVGAGLGVAAAATAHYATTATTGTFTTVARTTSAYSSGAMLNATFTRTERKKMLTPDDEDIDPKKLSGAKGKL